MIQLSPAAITEVNRIRAQASHHNSLFRLSVQAGGCADLYYVLELDDQQPGDQLLHCNGLEIVVDAESLQYLKGLKLDYTEDLMGGGFRFHNPNAVQSCGCGNSFSVAPSGLVAPSA
jgi:iron-sulfur cluster assembly accessory protein